MVRGSEVVLDDLGVAAVLGVFMLTLACQIKSRSSLDLRGFGAGCGDWSVSVGSDDGLALWGVVDGAAGGVEDAASAAAAARSCFFLP